MELSEAFLKKFVLIGAVLGIFCLYMYSGQISLDTVQSIDGMPKDTEVKIQGEVLSVSGTDKVAFIEVANQIVETTEVVVFLDSNITLSQGDFVEAVGTTEEYKGEMELIASEITLLS